MAKIKIKGGVTGVVENKGLSLVQVGAPDQGAAVRTALAELLQAVDADPDLPAERGSQVRDRVRELQAAAAGPKRGRRAKLHALLADLTLLAAGTVATTGAVDAVRESLQPLLN
jgi:hypothetical protein